MSEITAGEGTIVPNDISCHCNLRFEKYCSIASGLRIVSGQHPAVAYPDCISNFPFKEHGWAEWYPPSRHGGLVDIGSDVWIGEAVTIMDGVVVGHGAVLAAGAMVVKDVPRYCVVAGNPAKVVKQRFTDEQCDRLCEIAWWDWPRERIEAWLPSMTNVEEFCRDAPVTPER